MKDLKRNKESLSTEERIQRDYYNRISIEYEKHYNDDNALKYREAIFNDFLQSFDFKGKRVLDAMCGGGQSTLFFLSRGAVVVGVDISENQLKEYHRKFPKNEVYNESILNFTKYEGEFDFIVTDSLHHMHPKVDECLAQFHNLLSKDGYLFVWEPSSGSFIDLLRKFWYRVDSRYFEENESSINLRRLTKDQKDIFDLHKKSYGGGPGYLFLLVTMALRFKRKISNRTIVRILILLELAMNKLQNRYTALWFMALYKKKTQNGE